MSSNWPTVKLGDFCKKIGSGATPRGGASVYMDDGEICLIRSQNVHNEGFNPNGLVYIDEDAAKKLSNVIVEENDVLLNITGDSVARVCLAKSRFLPARVNQHVAIIRPDEDEFDPRFIRYLLASPTYQNILLSIAAVGATRNALTKGMIENLDVLKPPIEQQIEMANQLEALDKKIDINSETNQTLEQIAQAIFKSWFVDFDPVKAKIETLAQGGSADDAELAAMRVISAKTVDELNSLKASNPEAFNKLAQTAALFPAAMQDSELGEIPEGWDNGTIEDVMQFSSERVDVSGLNLRNYISTENMLENKRGITTASSLPSVSSVPAFNENEILISNIRPYFKKIWLTEFKGGRSPDVLGFSLLDPEETEFAYNLLYQDRFFEYMMTTSKGAKMPRGDKSAIKQFSFPLPQKELRLVFSKHVRPFYPMIKNTNKESEHLHALRDALLPELLSGNLGRS
ncbi:restriction endonuclease subunit S [Vibrio vulnificus]|uniref:restriction endonuclease subunit S n=1 Tax=Vibrio vulnificus TaxID=672 RepID=UPI001CDD71FD|nr:restriction endonuclease subunit S [Vibrio vulnificus]MCA3904355.1 restriction endonuclease subunit S [Vibrio vulnificus]